MSGFAASKEQRFKVKHLSCAVCGGEGCDPAHLCARGTGGCDSPRCVVPLDRACHRLFDEGKLDLLPFLEPRYRVEVAHCVMHMGLVGAYRRLTGSREMP